MKECIDALLFWWVGDPEMERQAKRAERLAYVEYLKRTGQVPGWRVPNIDSRIPHIRITGR